MNGWSVKCLAQPVSEGQRETTFMYGNIKQLEQHFPAVYC